MNYWVELVIHMDLRSGSQRSEVTAYNGGVYTLYSGSESLQIVQSSLNDVDFGCSSSHCSLWTIPTLER